MEHINWYPGHMKKTRTLITENCKAVDVVVEVIDARIPVSSRNPILRELAGNKPRIILLNKKDLAHLGESQRWLDKLKVEGNQALLINANSGEGVKDFFRLLEKMKDDREGRRANIPFRIMVVGIPNVGKSSLINRMTGKKSTQIGDRPGVTKGKQWLTLPKAMQLLDTPGILWPKFEDPELGLHLAFCGAIKDEILDTPELALRLINTLREECPELLLARYKLDELGEKPMEAIGAKRGFLLKGGVVDYERTARTVLDEFRSGQMGAITLERAEPKADKNE